MGYKDKIDNIINRRRGKGSFEGKGHLQTIQKKKQFFQDLKEKLLGYETFRSTILEDIKNKKGQFYEMSLEDLELTNRVQDAISQTLSNKLDECLKECDRLLTRFDRDKINISVIGRARQGKSKLLQSISGLPATVIPDSNGGDCTGATSIIINEEGANISHAKVEFYSESELIGQINKYLETMGYSESVSSLDNIPSLERLISDFDGGKKTEMSSTQQSQFSHFRKYVEHFDAYKSLIRQKEIEISEGDIRKYVAQYDEQDNKTYQYLAVKKVTIFKEFNYKDAGSIVLVDTIGLGDTALGIKDKMLKTLKNDSDTALLIRLPNKQGDHWSTEDDEMYDEIAKAMGTQMLEKWLFVVLNSCTALGNTRASNAVRQQIKEKSLHVADLFEVNCADKDEVEKTLLIPVLDFLSDNLADVDENMMNVANELFMECFQELVSFVEKVSQIATKSSKIHSSLTSFINREHEERHKDFTKMMFELFRDYKRDKHSPCEAVQKTIENKIANVYNFIPSEQDILEKRLIGGRDDTPQKIFEDYENEIRNNVSLDFGKIKFEVLKPMEDELKKKICDLFYEREGWKSIPLVTTVNGDSTVEWLRVFSEEKLTESYPRVKAVVDYVLNFTLDIVGALQYEVEEALDYIDSEDVKGRPVSEDELKKTDENNTPENVSKIISHNLTNRMSLVENDLKGRFTKFIQLPNRLLFTGISKFRDNIEMDKDTQKEMEVFFTDNANVIISDKIHQIISSQNAFESLNTWISIFVSYGKSKDNFNF